MRKEADIQTQIGILKSLYTKAVSEWNTDQEYVDDVFLVPEIRGPHKTYRSGLGYKIVNSGAEQIITSNPKVYFDSKKSTATINDARGRLSEEVNYWVDIMRRGNPNIYKEFVKNLLNPGVSYIRLTHSNNWLNKDISGLPVIFTVPDSKTIFASFDESIDGIPNKVLVESKRIPQDVLTHYPISEFPQLKNIDINSKSVVWREYWEADTRYCSADGIQILCVPNPYGIVPFIRRYSGFGKNTSVGEFADLIVGDIRHARDLLRQECVMRSNITSIIGLFANRGATVYAVGKISDAQLKQFAWGEYAVRILDELGSLSDIKIDRDELSNVPPEMFLQWDKVKSEILDRFPFMSLGYASSGRDRDLQGSASKKRYETVIENTETGLAVAFEKALEIIKKIPAFPVPEILKENDLSLGLKCSVSLRAVDPVEEDRRITLGDRLRRSPDPAIDLETFHTKFLGYTLDESKTIIAKIMADEVSLKSPEYIAIAGRVAAKELGLEMEIEELRQENQPQQEGNVPATTQQRMMGEVETQSGAELGTQAQRGARKPPERYTRGE